MIVCYNYFVAITNFICHGSDGWIQEATLNKKYVSQIMMEGGNYVEGVALYIEKISVDITATYSLGLAPTRDDVETLC